MGKRSFCYLLLLAGSLVGAKPLREVGIAVISPRPTQVSIDAPSYLPLLVEGARLAIDESTPEMAKRGLRLKLREYFTEDVSLASVERMKEALSGDTLAAVGIWSTDDAVLMVPQLSGTDYLVVSPAVSATRLLPFQPNFLEYSPSNLELARAMEHLLAQNVRPEKVVAIVAWDAPNSKDFYESLSEEFRKQVHLIKTLEELPQLEAVTREAMSHNPDTILLPNYPVMSASLIKSLSQAGFRGLFIGESSWGEGSDPRFMRIVGDTPFIGISVRSGSKFVTTKLQLELARKLSERNPMKYVMGAGQYYDATNYVINLIRECGPSVTRSQVIKQSQLRRIHEGALGKKCLSASQCENHDFVTIRVDSHGFRLLTNDLYHFSGNLKEMNGSAKKN